MQDFTLESPGLKTGAYKSPEQQAEELLDKIQVKDKIKDAKNYMYLAYWPRHKKHFLMKVYRYEEDTLSPYYLNECRFADLDHHNILPIVRKTDRKASVNKSGDVTSVSFLLQEHPLCNLADLIMKSPEFCDDEKAVRTYFHHLVTGLEFLHINQIAHLNIKPENLVLSEDFQLKITNLSQAIYTKETPLGRGTTHYRSPEIKNGNCTKPMPADIYSLGVTLFTMRAGFIPYFEGTPVQGFNLQDLLMGDPEYFWMAHHQINKKTLDFSEEFKELFVSMVRKNPDDRITLQEIKKSEWFQGPIYSMQVLEETIKKRLDDLL